MEASKRIRVLLVIIVVVSAAFAVQGVVAPWLRLTSANPDLRLHGLIVLLLYLGGSGAMIAGPILVWAAVTPYIRGSGRQARYEFPPGEQGNRERDGMRRARWRGLGVVFLALALHGLGYGLGRHWFG
jgi:hypothetical protein